MNSVFLIKLVQFILSISLLVLLHEGGHFFFAKLFKVRVRRFYIFFNPKFHLFSTYDTWFRRLFKKDPVVVPEKTIKDKDEISLNALIYLTEHADEISVVFKSGRTYLMQQALEPYSERIAPGIERMFSRKELDYARISIAALLVGILSVWESRGRKESPRELLAIFKKFSMAANKSIPSVLSKE